MKLDIILRTHDKRHIHVSSEPRYCNAEKDVVIKKCVQSLVNSCNNSSHDITYWWYDDHSSTETIESLHKVFKNTNFPYNYIALDQEGWQSSGLAQFERGRDSTADLVYMVEDDYLHFPSAIEEMINAYLLFKKNLGQEVSIHPFDDPDNYKTDWIEPCRVVYGENRRWRTNKYSTFTFMASPYVIKKYWAIFYTMVTEYGSIWGESNNVHEGTTINRIWRDDIFLFTPIPSLALHMQYEPQKDPYLDWKTLWDSIKI